MSKISVRHSIFETNSSSSHALTMTSLSNFEEWLRGEVFFDQYNDTFIPAAQINQKIEKEYREESPDGDYDFAEYKQEWMEDNQCYDVWGWNKYIAVNWYSHLKYTYTSESGDKIVAFGYYGRD